MDNLRLSDATFHCPRCEETKPIPGGTSALEHIRCKACGNTTMAHHWRRANEPTSAVSPDMKKEPFARISTGNNNNPLILGVNRGILEAGHVYEIRRHLGELVIEDKGISVSVDDDDRLWMHDANWLIESGGARHLLTRSDIEAAAIQRPEGQ